MQSKRILIIALGSIGTRHFNNLKILGFQDIVLVSSKLIKPKEWDGHDVFPKLELALEAYQFTHAFVCSPTAFHVDQLKTLVQARVSKIYLEKPISHTLDDLEQFKTAAELGVQILVGYDLHYDPGLTRVRKLLHDKVIGKVYSANAFVGQYLPDWRPYEDHRKGMSASLERGGGVMLDLIHEFDYLIWLMGKAASVTAIYQKNRELEIETEDVADVLIRFESGASGTIHLDYHQRVLIRNCVLTGALGTIKWDLAARTVTLTQADKKEEVFDFSNFERNDRYLEIAKAFMEEESDDRICTFEQGVESLQLVMASKISSQSNSLIKFPLFK
ncbi:Gfo/Idh/MocA family oxidoreductase [Algoriphagus sp. C2-6-M1]|uniref:Gfo/Idh/MocA family protein n=1 Tax=Algoriphagus persicinus TaxID=3108754 RepID=UPI002B3F05E6|nr:Gfo/Idh/MocA family oxidoreductase [Algoriphagus sp. C2-6-M1]MEB2779605.1 Gfo/Idh/MocA family oxidoreductase [Algoriphagus sp. C2-6-M1]